MKLPPGSKKAKKGKLAAVHHADLWGTRKKKYAWLDTHDVTDTKWARLKPNAPNFWFVPKDESLRGEYEAYTPLREVMPESSNGIKTERDGVSIHFTPDGITKTVADFRTLREDQLRQKYQLGDDSRDWSIDRAKADVTAHHSPSCFRPVLYRPFDVRHTWFSGKSKGFIGTPGAAIMHHMLAGPNLGLLVCRQQISAEFSHLFCTDQMAECCAVSNRTKEITTLVPLYIYPRAKNSDELIVEESDGPVANLASHCIELFSEKLKLKFVTFGAGDRRKTFGPEDVLHYAYAIFHAPGYRTRYAEFLRIDFPRLPLTANLKLFRQLCEQGQSLVELHLLKIAGPLHVSFPEKGDNSVQEVTYTPPQGTEPGRVRINDEQHFENIPPEVWTFRVGSYQVCEKWLKDRRGRQLTIDERATYPRIVAALAETLRLQTEIDNAIAANGGWPLR